MSQTRTQSAIEASVNILVGYTVNICANFAIFPLFGWEITLEQNLTIGVFYTVVSFLRSFGLRRFYNWWHGPRAYLDSWGRFFKGPKRKFWESQRSYRLRLRTHILEMDGKTPAYQAAALRKLSAGHLAKRNK